MPPRGKGGTRGKGVFFLPPFPSPLRGRGKGEGEPQKREGAKGKNILFLKKSV